MRALLVTSKVTFIPENYDHLVLKMADSPFICGLLVLDNSNFRHILQGLGVSLLGAYRTGFQLTRNQIFNRSELRKNVYEGKGKFYRELKTINSDAALDLISSEKVDLIVNARTRYIYKPEILGAPTLGCINIHHGLLPEQRGTMCDLWALSEGRPTGFSIHQMTAKIDAGGILNSTIVQSAGLNYQSYLLKASRIEPNIVNEALEQIAETGQIQVQKNLSTGQKHFKNPNIKQILQMQLKGMKL